MSTIVYTPYWGSWRIIPHKKFSKWLNGLDQPQRDIIEARLKRIKEEGEFGNKRHLGEGIYELKWKSGWRVYYSYGVHNDGRLIVLYLGGRKNGQKKDIECSKRLAKKYR